MFDPSDSKHVAVNLLQYSSVNGQYLHVALTGERRGVYRVLVEKPEGRRPLGRPRRRWEDNIKMDLQEVGWGEWTGLILLRLETCGGHL
jgi:hypothetical protein